ncbi:Hsp70 family protein [Calycomorphotria hydatis]|uniref:Chaperone protein dnaK2 n=1 Tax=Calycomorphotria hydatis TaxID=2528027 RepID=A0A517TCV8_9PLAN|nr:Hsp70 family protein [Calycomorphotria hydatis]QDT66209.1 Chaperone protein dnaK2 [Calycomorphotria hydatis]
MSSLPAPAVGIDLGTTYSTIACMNQHGEPMTIPNADGEFSTPSVVLYENGEPIVGTHALRSAIRYPGQVIQQSKRFMGEPEKQWVINGKAYKPVDVASHILTSLIESAEPHVGKIKHAVITVPALFGDVERRATIEAGLKAGLEKVDLINEPVAAALCHVLGSEGLWFTEVANPQRLLVFDLGGGTLDLSIVKYSREEVSVLASGGDLKLGGYDWNLRLLNAISRSFTKDFDADPRKDAESLQLLSNEIEQAKRALSVRPRATLTCQHEGHRKTYVVQRDQFERLTQTLVNKCTAVTLKLLKKKKFGWAHIDTVLTTGGASRMPMVRGMLKKMSGTTLNTSLSPDLSVAHGACYYAGMLMTNNDFARAIVSRRGGGKGPALPKTQLSVSPRSLGLLVREQVGEKRVPHFIIAQDTPLPIEVNAEFGTVIDNQKQIKLPVIESDPTGKNPFAPIGTCDLLELPDGLPEGTKVNVKITYDRNGIVHVKVVEKTSGKSAETDLKILPSRSGPDRNTPKSSAEKVSDTSPQAKPSPKTAPGKVVTTTQRDEQMPADEGESQFWHEIYTAQQNPEKS